MKWFLFLAIIVIIFSGCRKNKNADVDILSKTAMTTVLWDMIQVDEFATANLIKDTTKNIKIERIKLYQQVFKLHKISDKEFAASFKYYTGRPDIMKEVFDSLSSRADRERRIMYMPKVVVPK